MSALEIVRQPLNPDEDSFCLAVIEFGGNLAAAYRAVYDDGSRPIAKAQELISRPEIAVRIKELQQLTNEHALISLGSHMLELAQIRDLAKETGQLKVALSAETNRGKVAGFYGDAMKSSTPQGPSVVINMPATPQNIQEWAAQRGTQAVIIDTVAREVK